MSIRCERTKYSVTERKVFPGISLFYLSSHVQEAVLNSPEVSQSVIEVFHCREGRMECGVEADYCYLSPGDLLIARAGRVAPSFYFPLRHYHGLIVRINVDEAPKCLSCFLQDVNVEPRRIAEKFCGQAGYLIARSNPSFEHIFSELYAAPAELQQAYSKIKVLELMLFLSAFDPSIDRKEYRTLPPAQVALAKSVAAYLTEHMDERCTIDQAASIFHVSATNIKNSFKVVYGVSFYAFLKARKMESAAYMLEYTDKTIMEIAGEHGYDNAGKFSSAFRSVKGVTPGEYRQKNRKWLEGD